MNTYTFCTQPTRRLGLLVVVAICLHFSSLAMTVADLHCEHRINPQGVDGPQPQLSWTLQSATRADRQTAYEILAASSEALLQANTGDLWDSGKVNSDDTLQIAYGGKKLQSSQSVFWKVRVWDASGRASAWSAPATWTMGLLTASAWEARWITASGAEKYGVAYPSAARADFTQRPAFARAHPHADHPGEPNFSSLLARREFTVKPGLVRAVIHVTGLGHYELSVNGRKVGNALFAPGWTNYRQTVLYDTFDLTPLLPPGGNAVGLILGNGMYNIQPDYERYVKFLNSFGPLKAIAQLRLEYADGTVETVATGRSWQVAPGPITFNNIYGGEDWDARQEQAGWDQPGFVAGTNWSLAQETTGPGGGLKGLSCAAPPVGAMETLPPVATNHLNDHAVVFDLGQNCSLMPRLLVSGARGSRVRILPAELLAPDGSVDRRSCTQDGVRPAWWQYTLAGGGEESHFPKFFYQGCRYLQVELFPADEGGELPEIQHLEGVVIQAASPPVGEFATANPLFNRIYRLVRWAQRSNMQSIMTDCPHREKLGWLEQTHLNGPSLRYNFDMAVLLQKTMNDMADAQLADGFVPNIAPEYFIAGPANEKNSFRNSPEWGGAFLLDAWQQYEFDGDLTLFRSHYADMKRYVAFLDRSATNKLVTTGLGDWYDLGPKPPWGSQLTPPALTATAFYQHFNWILARAAALLGKPGEEQQFATAAESIRAAFNQAFYRPDLHQYATGSQCANALALVLNLVAATNRAAVMDNLVADVRAKGLTAGDVGYRYLLRALAENGRSDVIYALNNQSDKPGYGYQLKMGATSLTEKWDAGVGSFGSQNHFMLGQINEWFFHDLAGIQCDPAGPGFKKIILRPAIVGDLAWVKAAYRSVHGVIAVEWHHEGGRLTLKATIPANTTATVYLPAAAPAEVKEGQVPAGQATGVQSCRWENHAAILEIGSGTYEFSVVGSP